MYYKKMYNQLEYHLMENNTFKKITERIKKGVSN